MLFLTWKSLAHHRVIALITVAGVAIGMSVMATVLVVDHNTARSETRARKVAEPLRCAGQSVIAVNQMDRLLHRRPLAW